ncbi:Scr1 family TA system antitoxin-like transcriptional regulator [Streptomyces sp. NPDC057702]|uniref:helix-turn-helix domain-containing protein n=1 Tax=unclassified Streptomyces TaxID=2593676 RepID=UPI0036BE2181
MELHETKELGGRATARTFPGRQLRRLREQAGLSLRGLAEKLHYPHSYISRVERHEQLPSEALANALDDHFGTGELFVDALAIAQDSLVMEYSHDYLSHEAKCIRLQVFTSSLVPGLLQTRDYARALFSFGLRRSELPALEEHVALRLRRQKLLEGTNPPQYWAIMDESALRRLVADRHIMTEQLCHVLQAAEQPHINIQVLPFTEPFHPLMGGSLTLLTMENGTTTALVESYGSGDVVDVPRQVVDLVQRFDVARAQALTPADSLELIHHYVREYT